MKNLLRREHGRQLAVFERTHNVLVTASGVTGFCPVCQGSMVVRKTLVRGARTLAHGTFRVHETEYVCSAGCHEPSGMRVRRRPGGVGEVLLPGRSVGYDVMVHIGLQRYLHHKQREEIQTALAEDHDVVLSTGEISNLARLFLSYVERLHQERRPQIREVLEQDGGWPLHIDATGEDGRGTLLVLYAAWREWVLGAYKIPTENAEAIRPCIDSVVEWAGCPVAIVRDLGRAMIPACESFRSAVAGDFPILSCHYHFLADIGKDLLDSGHSEFRALFRRFGVRPYLGALVRELGRRLGPEIGPLRQAVLAWQRETTTEHRLPEGPEGIAVVRALIQWVLDYSTETQGQDFPFALPYLAFYDRCSEARRAVDAFVRTPPADPKVLGVVKRLATILDKVCSDVPFRTVSQQLRRRQALFDELRHALRLVPKESGKKKQVPASERPASELKDIQLDVAKLRSSLTERRIAPGLAQDTLEAMNVILDHLDRYGDTLWGHIIALPAGAASEHRIVERTNDILENFFRGMKQGERRRSGRKSLTQDLEALPPAAALALNLRKPDYVDILCGSLDRLPRVFAELDAHQGRLPGAGSTPLDNIASHPGLKTATASLPLEDRRIVRTKSMTARILSAATSRHSSGSSGAVPSS